MAVITKPNTTKTSVAGTGNTTPIKRDIAGPLVAQAVEPKKPTTDMIRERAYQIYLAHKDQKDRNPMLDWLQAERELLAGR